MTREEREKIKNIVSTCDDGIEKAKQAVKAIERIKEVMLEKLRND